MRKKTLPMAEKQRETPFHLLFKLFLFIYQHKETYVVVPKIESENIACIVPHEIHYCFGSHLRISGETPINFFLPGRVAQSVTCLATDAYLTADPGVASSIPARYHTFVEIDH